MPPNHEPGTDRADLEWCFAELERLRTQNRELRQRLETLRLGRRILLALLAREAARRERPERQPGRRSLDAPAGRSVRRYDEGGSTRIVSWPTGDPDPAGQG